MTVFVVDTNVAMAANGRNTHADESCQSTCEMRLWSLVNDEELAVDDLGLILEEYGRRLNFSGAPGMGDAFFKHLFNKQFSSSRIQRVAVTPTDDSSRGFDELPPNKFDPSDRKFLAVAVAAKAVVLNAMDSDWGEQRQLMEDLGVTVGELCPQHVGE